MSRAGSGEAGAGAFSLREPLENHATARENL
jgi:hypothetical protein